MKSDLFIRTDGSAEIGLGHLVRCISLSYILHDQFNISFICRNIPEQMRKELDQLGISLKVINREQQFLDDLTENNVVVLDGYSFDTAYQKKIKEKESLLVCIDDLHNKEFYADLIINHAPGIQEKDYSAQTYTQCALGLDYALLRPPFLKAASTVVLEENRNVETILICFGGSDSKNLTLRALNVVFDFNQFKKIIIITGSAYSFKNELLQEIKDNKKVEYHHALSGKEMASVFMKSDVALIPSSGILFEALATGNIAISGTYTDNQKKVYAGFKKLKAIVDAGEFGEKEIGEAIQKIDSHKNQQKLIDGKSPERIRDLFQSIRRD